MKLLEKGAPTGAMIAALSTLACCLPMGFVGALGLAGLAVRIQPLRLWFVAASIVLLCVGFGQLYLRRSCTKRSIATIALFWAAVVVVLLVLLFPQVVASLIAG